jgi:hypothetical protein
LSRNNQAPLSKKNTIQNGILPRKFNMFVIASKIYKIVCEELARHDREIPEQQEKMVCPLEN